MQNIDNNWKCKLEKLEYSGLKFFQYQRQIFWANSNVSFNIKENKLIIPKKYYSLIVRSYKTRKDRNSIKYRLYNKFCRLFDEIIYCSCDDKDDFGIVTFHFGNNSKLDIDLRNYVYYNNSADFYKCRIDVILSENNEFVVGLRGLNNTLLSFNMEEKKKNFFHKIKKKDFFWIFIIYLISALLYFCFLEILIIIICKH